MMNKIFLCLDFGTTMGYALSSNDEVSSGTVSFKNNRFEGGDMRYLRFRKWLCDLYTLEPFTVVYFEEVRRHLSTDASHLYGGFLATLNVWCNLQVPRVAFSGVPVGTIKKSATGRGNASKKDIIEAIRNLGYSPQDDNEADALALLHYIKGI